ncbi:MAG: PaaI family thioesterase [Eubacterium sp.]|nr:PaaI family thioesterase [Eubacterium sp.]
MMKSDTQSQTISREKMLRCLEYRQKHNNFGSLLGIEILDFGEGYAKAVMPVRPEFLNPLGTVHGGCLYSLADTVGGNASATFGYITPTVSGDLHFLRPAKGMDRIYGVAKMIKHGRSLGVYRVTLYGPDEETELATGTFTYFSKGKPILSDDGDTASAE